MRWRRAALRELGCTKRITALEPSPAASTASATESTSIRTARMTTVAKAACPR